MEIPEINMISNFEAGMKCLQNPSLISRFSSFPEKVPRVYSFWKWGALIFAIFATFSSIVRRIKLIFIRFHTFNKPSLLLHNNHEEVIEFDEDDDDISLASSSDDENEQEHEEQHRPANGQRRVDHDFSVKGSFLLFKRDLQNGQLRQRRRRNSGGGAWSEFYSGKNVVKLWDSLGLSLDFDEDLFSCESKSVVSTWDLDQDRKTGELSRGFWKIPATAPMESTSAVLAAEGSGNGGVFFGAYDTRMPRGAPALFAEWCSPLAAAAAAEVGGVCGGGFGNKVYVRDDVSGVVTVGDVRNVRRPLESGGETWWDADAVIVEKE